MSQIDNLIRDIILSALRRSNNDKHEAAALLGISVKVLYEKMHQYAINVEDD